MDHLLRPSKIALQFDGSATDTSSSTVGTASRHPRRRDGHGWNQTHNSHLGYCWR